MSNVGLCNSCTPSSQRGGLGVRERARDLLLLVSKCLSGKSIENNQNTMESVHIDLHALRVEIMIGPLISLNIDL